MAQSKRKSQEKPARLKENQENKVDNLPATEEDGKLSPWEAEAIMSSDLPSGDPELTPPAPAADQSPDYQKDSQREGADVQRGNRDKAA